MATLERDELHYGDRLTVMREKILDEIADLIYLDPPLDTLLEDPRNPFEIPDTYRVGKPEGVGKKEAEAQMGMELG